MIRVACALGFLIAVSVVLLCLSGCTSLPSAAVDKAYYFTNTIDYAQTINIAKRPDCYYENDVVTRNLIGRQPSESKVAAAFVVETSVHYAVSRWLDSKADNEGTKFWYTAANAFQWLKLANSTYNVVHNHSIGLRPLGSGCGAGNSFEAFK